MKRLLGFLSAAAAIVAVAPATAAVLTPASAVATSSWYAPISPDRLIDGSGLSGVGPLLSQTHDNDPAGATMWHGGPNDAGLGGPTGNPPTVADQAVVFDLGTPAELSAAYIWNFSQSGAGASRSTDELEISVSTDTDPLTASFASVGTFNLAPTAADGTDLAQTVNFGGTYAGVRLVRFDINSAHSGALQEYVGLAEVRFEGVAAPEPAAFVLAGLAVAAVAAARRK